MSIPCATIASSISCFNIPTSVPRSFLRGDLYLQTIFVYIGTAILSTFTETVSLLSHVKIIEFYLP